MGLDFSHSDIHYSYSGFYRLRKKLAYEIKIDIEKMRGFGGEVPWNIDDPIVIFINHSDCDGNLSPKECVSIGKRLKELVSHWDTSDRERAEQLANDMLACAEMGENFEFC